MTIENVLKITAVEYLDKDIFYNSYLCNEDYINNDDFLIIVEING